ncbi:uncharacterized protein LOC123559513 [Mercenaria mercenaria]|uniref:uncharacterized protein LOC123559513 n=1 Tax=Mercenaria mercenaria TaxID=6596 RepID=UPI00234FA8A7|nr:uncharacterized protein LOC123559513 [Mercenaria mercenaria]
MENSFESEEEDEEAGICYDFTKKTWRDDVTFIVEGQHLHATKAILAMESPVFEAMFGTNFRERDEKEVNLPGKKYEDFKEFLHCIYPKSKKKIDKRNVYKVLPLADEYDVKSLIKECKRFLNAHLINDRPSTQEVMFCHGLATRHKFQSLRKVCATRLSDVGLKEIESTAAGVSDTETLLQIHKDILKQQGETLEETRTELVKLYLDKNLPEPLQPSMSEVRGSVIKFKPNINSLDEQEPRFSNSVTLWNISFRVYVQVTKRVDERCLSLYMHPRFPRNNNYSSCCVNAIFFLKCTGRVGRQPYKIRMNNCEFLDGKARGYEKLMTLTNLANAGFMENGTLDIVVYLLAKKPSVKD